MLSIYRPSLSSAVHNVIYSFWRLSGTTRSLCQSSLPKIRVDVDGVVVFDWNSWLSVVEANIKVDEGVVNEVETTWALALQSEQFIACGTVNFHQGSGNSTWRAVAGFTHAGSLEEVARMLSDDVGEYFLAFEVSVTILEKMLYDLHDEKLATSGLDKNRKKNMILRDLLHSDTLIDVLPEGLLRLLKILFLPSGLNLRNLVWHGFMAPAEFPKCFGCLVLLLIMALPGYLDRVTEVTADKETELFSIDSFDARFITRFREPLGGEDCDVELDLLTYVKKSFVGGQLLHSSLSGDRICYDALSTSWWNEETSCGSFLRCYLCLNTRCDLSFFERTKNAQIDAYYSTLDGFGQKDKHQVLLHPVVMLDAENKSDEKRDMSRESVANALYEKIPFASLAVLLDLFMMSSGPNLRAKLCHGEALLSTFGDDCPAAKISSATRLLFETLVLLCENSRNQTDQAGKWPLSPSVSDCLQLFSSTTTCSFHPFYRLHLTLNTAHCVASDFVAFRSTWSKFRLENLINGEPDKRQTSLTRVAFDAITTQDNIIFTLVEKTERIEEFQSALFGNDSSSAEARGVKSKKKNFAQLMGQLNDQLVMISSRIYHDFKANHRSDSAEFHSSVFLALMGTEFSAVDRTKRSLNLLEKSMERRLLALSDQDGLSVTSCMMEIITCCQRSLQTFRSRIEQLQQLVVEGKARTNHRRSLLASIFFLPVFERMQLVSLSIVEHQLLHLHDVAAGIVLNPQLERRTTDTSLCPQAIHVERLQRKLLQCITSFEGCTGSSEASQKSGEQAVERALQFLNSKAMKLAFPPLKA
ncbi:Hypothetical protein PHPALM_3278 [Phytophthora palmivora]|uniref:DUF4209 domain-containing protein n=1 Tax=Phytophthora palmivora TaxID=4796 RepID=A0A2P4YMT9_9STRA|nr:Hypothetical protein PHPALM_3278 [Phytophthora palmivora]